MCFSIATASIASDGEDDDDDDNDEGCEDLFIDVVKVKNSSNRTITSFDITQATTVMEVKLEIEAATCVPIEQQRVFWGGRELFHDWDPMADIGCCGGSLGFVVKLWGGSKRGRRSPHDIEGLYAVELPRCAQALKVKIAGPWNEEAWTATLVAMDEEALTDMPSIIRGGTTAAKTARMLEKVAE